MSPMIKQPLSLEHSLLGFLKQRPMHAYAIHQTLDRSRALGLVWHVKQSQCYALLARLEEEGYVEGVMEPQEGRPPRKVLHLTPAGRAAFADWVTAPVERGRDVRMEFMAKLFFAAREGAGTVATLVAAQRRVFQEQLDEVQAQAQNVRGQRPFDWLVLRFRRGQLDAMLDWLDVCEATLAGEEAE